MSTESHESIKQVLESFADPETGRPLRDAAQVGELRWDGDCPRVTIRLSTHSLPLAERFCERLRAKVAAEIPGTNLEVAVEAFERDVPRLGQFGLRVRSVIVVGSGKGGVGKSTVAASIALVLRRFGARVGLMDADVYGPSIPHLLGLEGRPAVTAEKRIEPIRLGNMPVMSMGFLVDPEQAVIWRGPMLHGSITQFLRDTDWGELDYLIIDMPPGTGDIALTLSQAVPLSAGVVVCTPQEVALLDAVKAISMFRKVDIPIAGMVENMSGFVCPDCNRRYDIFGSGGARERAEQMHVPFLGELPINIRLREAGDAGRLAEALENDMDRSPLEVITVNLVDYLALRAASQKRMPSLPTL
jgi:ATP-binding protein involved in chromosome partitioning